MAETEFSLHQAQHGGRFGREGFFGRLAGVAEDRHVCLSEASTGSESVPPGSQFKYGLSGLVDLPRFRVKLMPLVVQKGHGGLGEGFR